ncbi:HNH endonuclease signature motif containing protein [Humibacter soli]
MKELLDAVQSALDAARAASSTWDAAGMAPGELVSTMDALGLLRRTVDAALLPVAAEIARQSRQELGRDSLAKKQGFRTPGVMISTTTGTSTGEAIRMVAVGEATAPRMAMSGEALPARHPHVGEAVKAGLLSTLQASAIIGMLDRVGPRTDPVSLEEMEVRLVDAAPGLNMDHLHALVNRAEAILDPDGVQPREEQLRADRGLTIHQDRNGAIRVNGTFDPEGGAPIVAAVQGIVSGMLRRRDDGTSVSETDGRSISQMRADVLSELCRHVIGCESVPTAPSTTVVVRMSLDDLRSGTGSAEIDGLVQPISIGTARRMAADAQLIPCVLGGDSEILDWGRAKRAFTRAQKLALSERDGGCSFCGSPPSITAAHHIAWWRRDAGPTDLSNGVLLCTSCHHRIHDDGWEIRIEGADGDSVTDIGGTGARSRVEGAGAFRTAAKVWFVPPAWLDASRTPRLGGRARYGLTA